MVVSLRANKKRIIAFLVLAAIVVGACIFLVGGDGEEEEVKEFFGATNEERIAFLQSFGWEVSDEPTQTREVMIPAEFNDVYTAYNVMQQAQGFDLKPYAGEVCTQYQYKILNYPDNDEVYATLLVYGDRIIGGDIASSAVDGFMHGFAPDSAHFGETTTGGGSNEESKPESTPPESSAPESSMPAESANELVSEASAVESTVTEETGAESAPESSVVSSAEGTAAEVIPEEAFPTD